MAQTYRSLFRQYGIDYAAHRQKMKALRKEGLKTSVIAGAIKLGVVGIVAVFHITWAWFIVIPALLLSSIHYALKYVRAASSVYRDERQVFENIIVPDINNSVARAAMFQSSELEANRHVSDAVNNIVQSIIIPPSYEDVTKNRDAVAPHTVLDNLLSGAGK